MHWLHVLMALRSLSSLTPRQCLYRSGIEFCARNLPWYGVVASPWSMAGPESMSVPRMLEHRQQAQAFAWHARMGSTAKERRCQCGNAAHTAPVLRHVGLYWLALARLLPRNPLVCRRAPPEHGTTTLGGQKSTKLGCCCLYL